MVFGLWVEPAEPLVIERDHLAQGGTAGAAWQVLRSRCLQPRDAQSTHRIAEFVPHDAVDAARVAGDPTDVRHRHAGAHPLIQRSEAGGQDGLVRLRRVVMVAAWMAHAGVTD
jgi:hypothetical protein